MRNARGTSTGKKRSGPTSNKRKKKILQAKRTAIRLHQDARVRKKLADEGRLANGVVMPHGAVAADLSKQAPHNTYSPRLFYVDIEFTCRDCGVEEEWTAKQQKWYYEVARGPIYGKAVRCRACRNKVRDKKAAQLRRMKEASQAKNVEKRTGRKSDK